MSPVQLALEQLSFLIEILCKTRKYPHSRVHHIRCDDAHNCLEPRLGSDEYTYLAFPLIEAKLESETGLVFYKYAQWTLNRIEITFKESFAG